VEAFQFGTPVLALAWGGYLETCQDGVTGYFIAEPSLDAVISAISRLRIEGIDESRVQAAAEPFSLAAFSARLREVAAEVAGARPSAAADPAVYPDLDLLSTSQPSQTALPA
jgi:glycosyltransferase involved in cell wall biosynthesis